MFDTLRYSFNHDSLHVNMIEESPLFRGKDVATSVKYANTRKALLDHVYSDARQIERVGE